MQFNVAIYIYFCIRIDLRKTLQRPYALIYKNKSKYLILHSPCKVKTLQKKLFEGPGSRVQGSGSKVCVIYLPLLNKV